MSRENNINTRAISIKDWCRAFGLCRASWYQMQARGDGPKTFRVGSRILISTQAVADWVAAREAASAKRTSRREGGA
jgi:predicted DNA-binding transcriptional regulator AlpA